MERLRKRSAKRSGHRARRRTAAGHAQADLPPPEPPPERAGATTGLCVPHRTTASRNFGCLHLGDAAKSAASACARGRPREAHQAKSAKWALTSRGSKQACLPRMTRDQRPSLLGGRTMAATAARSSNHMAIIDFFTDRHRIRRPVTRVTASSPNHRYWTPATRRQSLFPSGYRGCSTHRGSALVAGPLFLCATGRCCGVVCKEEKGFAQRRQEPQR